MNFADDKEFTDFLQLVKGRSMFDFQMEVGKSDKIITLSTCLSGSERMVMHAKLVSG